MFCQSKQEILYGKHGSVVPAGEDGKARFLVCCGSSFPVLCAPTNFHAGLKGTWHKWVKQSKRQTDGK